jgi:hypothetical protein
MLHRSDRDISGVMRDLAAFGLEAAYLVPTDTGLKKSILDAHASLRRYFLHSGLHDYRIQGQGASNKRVLSGMILTPNGWLQTSVSLYRPTSKAGDPRIWISKLTQFARPWNLIVLLVKDDELFIINSSDRQLWATLNEPTSPLAKLISQLVLDDRESENALLERLFTIARQGFIPSTTGADSGVGDTLERLLGIVRNADKTPDFRGIEIKASRLNSKTGRQANRNTLFSESPNWFHSTLKNGREIVEKYGYVSAGTGKRALQVTLGSSPNAQGLYLLFNDNQSVIENRHQHLGNDDPVVLWELPALEARLAEKHKSTFWVKANAENKDGFEHFQYVSAQITSNPLVANFGPLVASGKIQLDYTFSEKTRTSGQSYIRDHGYLWKIKPANLGLLFPPARVVDLVATESHEIFGVQGLTGDQAQD